MTENAESTELVELAADIVSAYVSNNTIVASDLPGLIKDVCEGLAKAAAKSAAPAKEELKPAVSVRSSVTPDHIVCLEEGQKFKSLKRHIRTQHGLSPDEYRERWGLPYDYPMTAPNYAAERSRLAMKIGLGRKPKG